MKCARRLPLRPSSCHFHGLRQQTPWHSLPAFPVGLYRAVADMSTVLRPMCTITMYNSVANGSAQGAVPCPHVTTLHEPGFLH